MPKKRVTSAIGLVIILAAVLLVIFYLKGPSPVNPLVSEVIELRSVVNDSVKKAGKISKIDGYAGDIDNEAISDAWGALTECLNNECADDDYFNFLFVVFSEKSEEIENAEVLINLVKVNRYWGSEEVVEFSKALSFVNDAIEELNQRDIEKKWNEIVECENVCEGRNTLYFELIKKLAG